MIRRAVQADLDGVSEIYEHIHQQEQQKKICVGWVPGVYPTKATAREALGRGDLFVYVEQDKILAAAVINQVQVEGYAEGNWAYQAPDEEVMVIHTLVVDPCAAARGIGREFIAFYETYAREAGCKVLRLDTNEKNTVARRFYAKLGYSEADVIPCDFNGIPNIRLVLLEKLVV